MAVDELFTARILTPIYIFSTPFVQALMVGSTEFLPWINVRSLWGGAICRLAIPRYAFNISLYISVPGSILLSIIGSSVSASLSGTSMKNSLLGVRSLPKYPSCWDWLSCPLLWFAYERLTYQHNVTDPTYYVGFVRLKSPFGISLAFQLPFCLIHQCSMRILLQ